MFYLFIIEFMFYLFIIKFIIYLDGEVEIFRDMGRIYYYIKN